MNATTASQEFFGYAKEVYGMLEDEESKDIFLNKILHHITKDYKYVKPIVSKHISECFDKDEIKQLLKDENGKMRKLVIYGAGNWGFHLYNAISTVTQGEIEMCFCDRDTKKIVGGGGTNCSRNIN